MFGPRFCLGRAFEHFAHREMKVGPHEEARSALQARYSASRDFSASRAPPILSKILSRNLKGVSFEIFIYFNVAQFLRGSRVEQHDENVHRLTGSRVRTTSAHSE